MGIAWDWLKLREREVLRLTAVAAGLRQEFARWFACTRSTSCAVVWKDPSGLLERFTLGPGQLCSRWHCKHSKGEAFEPGAGAPRSLWCGHHKCWNLYISTVWFFSFGTSGTPKYLTVAHFALFLSIFSLYSLHIHQDSLYRHALQCIVNIYEHIQLSRLCQGQRNLQSGRCFEDQEFASTVGRQSEAQEFCSGDAKVSISYQCGCCSLLLEACWYAGHKVSVTAPRGLGPWAYHGMACSVGTLRTDKSRLVRPYRKSGMAAKESRHRRVNCRKGLPTLPRTGEAPGYFLLFVAGISDPCWCTDESQPWRACQTCEWHEGGEIQAAQFRVVTVKANDTRFWFLWKRMGRMRSDAFVNLAVVLSHSLGRTEETPTSWCEADLQSLRWKSRFQDARRCTEHIQASSPKFSLPGLRHQIPSPNVQTLGKSECRSYKWSHRPSVVGAQKGCVQFGPYIDGFGMHHPTFPILLTWDSSHGVCWLQPATVQEWF